MPKVAVSVLETKNRVARGSIKNALEVQGMSVEKLSALTGIPKSTLHSKIREPEKFNVREMRLVFKALHFPAEEKERFARDAL